MEINTQFTERPPREHPMSVRSVERITSPLKLARIQACLAEGGPILVEHWSDRSSVRPVYKVFEEYENFAMYLKSSVCAGDALHVWDLRAMLRDDNKLAYGKYPHARGLIAPGKSA
jgi:hypothetical protein